MELGSSLISSRNTVQQARSYQQTHTDHGSNSTTQCIYVNHDQIVIARSAFIAGITVCITVTALSLLGLITLLVRQHLRSREHRAANTWGRKSTYIQRMSFIRKEIDDSYSRQYRGCFHNMPENPEMGSDSPIEIMTPERVWEAPAVPAKTATQEKERRKSRVKSLFFDHDRNLWMAKS